MSKNRFTPWSIGDCAVDRTEFYAMEGAEKIDIKKCRAMIRVIEINVAIAMDASLRHYNRTQAFKQQ